MVVHESDEIATEVSMNARATIISLCLLAAASLLLSGFASTQLRVLFFIVGGISLALALYLSLQLRK
jgi:1,4-dihydroxy-2-naphthoate octaprenyltransferase